MAPIIPQAPVVANPIADQTATISTAFSFSIPANAFSDPDAGDTLTYTATLADSSNSPLPSWLTFNAATKTFSGTPPTGTGNLNLRVKATDNGGLSVTDDFAVTTSANGGSTNQLTPYVNTSNQPRVIENPIDVNGTIYGLDGMVSRRIIKLDPVTGNVSEPIKDATRSIITSSQSPPNWVNVNGTLVFLGGSSLDPASSGLWKVDASGKAVLFESTNNNNASGDRPTQFNNLTNVDGILYFSGNRAAFDKVNYTVQNYGYEIYKLDPATGATTFIEVEPGTGSSNPANFTSINGTLYFTATTVGSGTELWKLNAAGNPQKLEIIAGTGSSNPANFTKFNNNLYFSVLSGSTGAGLYKIDTTTGNPIKIVDANVYETVIVNGEMYFRTGDFGRDIKKIDASDNITQVSLGTLRADGPLTSVNNTLYFRTYTVNGTALSKLDASGNIVVFDNVPGTGSGGRVDHLTKVGNDLYFVAQETSASDLKIWKIDSATGQPVEIGTSPQTNYIRQTIGLESNSVPVFPGSDGFLYKIGTGTTPTTNNPPVVANAITDQNSTIGTAFSFVIPANAFSDPDAGNTLTYSATLANGSILPSWLTFDAATRTLSGTPPTGTSTAPLTLRITATDNGSLSVSDDFDIAIGGSTVPPLTGIRKITTSTTGAASNGESFVDYRTQGTNFSGDGRYVLYSSAASNLVTGDDNNQQDTFLYDRVNNTNIRITNGGGGAGISRNGRYVAYTSSNAAGNPVLAVYDTVSLTTTQSTASIFFNGSVGISDDGRYVSGYVGGGDVSLLDLSTNTVTAIPKLAGTAVGLSGPAMSPNGSFFIYAQNDGGNRSNAINGTYRYNIATGVSTKIGDALNLSSFVSADGRYLYYLDGTTFTAKKMDLTDNTVTDGNIELLGDFDRFGNAIQISEDGQFRLIFAADSLNTIPNDSNGFNDLFIQAVNGGGGSSGNRTPILSTPIANQVADNNTLFSFVIPSTTFSDPDAGDTLTYSVTLGDDSALPAWLTYDAATRTLSGTPPTGSSGLDIKVTARDSGNLSVSDTFRIGPASTTGGSLSGLTTTGNLFSTSSTLKGFAINPVSQSASQKVSEVAIFAVDDLTGKIGTLNPTDSGYLAAALNLAKPILSTLASPFFSTEKREIALDPSKTYQVIQITDGSLAQAKQQIAAGQTPNNILLSNSSNSSPIQVTENNGGYQININNNQLVLDVTATSGSDVAVPIGAKSQNLAEGRLIDLTDYVGQTMKISMSNASSAFYNNEVGFYEVKDLAGTITVNGQDLRPGDAGYAAGAVRNATLQTHKSGSQTNQDIAGGKIYAPVAIANGTFASFLANNSNNVNNAGVNDNLETFAYFNYVGANPDKIDHFRLLNNNTFGVEDTYGGGDRDFNDIKMSITINA